MAGGVFLGDTGGDVADLDYYLQKVEELLTSAKNAKDPQTKLELERLAEEYRVLVKRAKEAAEKGGRG